MADELENTDDLIMPVLIAFRNEVRTMHNRFGEDLQDIKVRVTNFEEAEGRTFVAIAGVNRRLDRVDERLAQIEK